MAVPEIDEEVYKGTIMCMLFSEDLQVTILLVYVVVHKISTVRLARVCRQVYSSTHNKISVSSTTHTLLYKYGRGVVKGKS